MYFREADHVCSRVLASQTWLRQWHSIVLCISFSRCPWFMCYLGQTLDFMHSRQVLCQLSHISSAWWKFLNTDIFFCRFDFAKGQIGTNSHHWFTEILSKCEVYLKWTCLQSLSGSGKMFTFLVSYEILYIAFVFLVQGIPWTGYYTGGLYIQIRQFSSLHHMLECGNLNFWNWLVLKEWF